MFPSDYSAMLPSHCHLFQLLKLANSVPPSAHYHGLQTEEATAAPSCAVTFSSAMHKAIRLNCPTLFTEASRAYSTMPGCPTLVRHGSQLLM